METFSTSHVRTSSAALQNTRLLPGPPYARDISTYVAVLAADMVAGFLKVAGYDAV